MVVDTEVCIGCGACVQTCPVSAISLTEEGKALIDQDTYIHCGACAGACRSCADQVGADPCGRHQAEDNRGLQPREVPGRPGRKGSRCGSCSRRKIRIIISKTVNKFTRCSQLCVIIASSHTK